MDFASMGNLRVSRPSSPHVVELELDHGKANEMGRAELADLEKLCLWLADAGEVRALITYSRKQSAKGTPIFQAGANVVERASWGDDEIKRHVRYQREVLAMLRRTPLFHVVVVHGIAFGWGCEYTLCGDWVIATDGARFALPETGLGIVPGAGGTSELLERVGAAQALRMGMTGEVVGAAEALRIGLVQQHVPTLDGALVRARAMALAAASRSPTANAYFKAGVIGSIGEPYHRRAEHEGIAYAHCVDAGEAALGRSHFAATLRGEAVPWGPRRSRSG